MRFVKAIICIIWLQGPLLSDAFVSKSIHTTYNKKPTTTRKGSFTFVVSGRGAARWGGGWDRRSNKITRDVRRISDTHHSPMQLRVTEDNSVSRNCDGWSRGTLGFKARTIIQKILRWQRRKRRNVLTAAALALSVLFCSRQHIITTDNFAPPTRNEIEVVAQQKRPLVSRIPEARGGSTSSWSRRQLSSVSSLAKASSCSATTATVAAPATSAASSDAAATSLSPKRKHRTHAVAALGMAEHKMEEAVVTASRDTARTLREGLQDLHKYMAGPKADTLLLLLATALVTPVCKRFGTSPILGFLAAGMLLGPNGYGFISGIHTTETLAELGIVFFLFEMGIELSVERLMSMKKDVFGLGFSQFIVTAAAIAGVGKLMGLPPNALVVLGGGLALSSSAFVLQLLKDKSQLATRFGKAAFGVLLFQDLAVVPLLVVTPILAGSGGGLVSAVGSAVVKASMALGSIFFLGRYVLNPLFKIVAQSNSQEAFLGVILLTVLSMSFMTEGLGLSNTLGAFLAGVLLSETKYRYQVEADIAPFRGILLGLFFVTVGFEIDVNLIASNLPLVGSIVAGILAIKALTITALSLAFGLSLSTSQQAGLILSQGGEFAFVTFGLARSLGILDSQLTKVMLTSVSLTMALTPFLANLGSRISKTLEERSDFTHYLGQDRDASEIKESDDFVVVVGYGVVGKVVTKLLDRKFVKYVGIEIDPNKAIQARNAGLPVFYGDIGRQEVAEAFNVGKAKAVIVCIADKSMTNRAVIALRRWYPDLKIFCRAMDADHANRLQKTLDVAAMVPILPEDNLLLTLPFGGAVLKSLGCPTEEVNAILESERKLVLSGRGLGQNEERMALLQLGIDTEDLKKVEEKDAIDAKAVTDEKDDNKRTKEAAAELLEEKKEKSPLVAQVIGEVCPDIVSAETESVKEEEPDLSPSKSEDIIESTEEEEPNDSDLPHENPELLSSMTEQDVTVVSPIIDEERPSSPTPKIAKED